MNSKSQDYEIGQKQYLITARNTIAYTQQETKLLFFLTYFQSDKEGRFGTILWSWKPDLSYLFINPYRES